MKQSDINKLLSDKNTIVKAISEIESMKRGTIGTYEVPKKRSDGTILRMGPYYNLSYAGKDGKTKSKAIPKSELEFYQRETARYDVFRRLTDEYIDICEQISELSHTGEGKKN